MRGIRRGIFNGIGMALIGLFLAILLTGSAWALTATDCVTCHGANVAASHHDTTNPNSDFNQGNCEVCHVGVTTSGDCTTCHTTAGFSNKHHIPPVGQTTIDCAQCHTGAGNPKDCGSCHQGEAPRNFHHTRLTAPIYYVNGKLNCAGCHPGAKLTNDCLACHVDPAQPAKNQLAHHNYAKTNNKPCTLCHTGMAPLSGSCKDCHKSSDLGGDTLTLPQDHHQFGMACSQCHAVDLTNMASTGCAQCHTSGNNRAFHHDTVNQNGSRTCGSCHQGTPAYTCATCHTGKTSAFHHTSADYLSNNCGKCHTSQGAAQNSCLTCHPIPSPSGGTNIHHDTATNKYIATNYGYGCFDCHTYNKGIQPVPPAACLVCHENFLIGRPSIPQTHHATSQAATGNCGLCHAGGGQVTARNCDTCHSPGSPKPATPAIHHALPGKTCNACHTTISGGQPCTACHTPAAGSTVTSRHHNDYADVNDDGTVDKSCDSCHVGGAFVDTDDFDRCERCHAGRAYQYSISNHHHTIFNNLLTCAQCHTGASNNTPPLNDCAACHLGAGKPSLATSHHSTATGSAYSTGQCTLCHQNTAPAAINCYSCHNDATLPAMNVTKRHHDNTVTTIVNGVATITPKPCRDCHTAIQLVGGSCQGCHTAPIPQIHHGDPLTAVNGNCAVCHQSVSSPSSCSTCHATTSHHTSTWSQTGDCAHCHLVPASAADRPVQAACLACHGTTMHGKGGPIKNYGACAACHDTTPFHGDTGIPDGSESRAPTNTGLGRGKFNIFMARNSAQGEEGKWQPNTQLIFSTKSISHAGKSYTVPYFTGAPSATVNLALGKTASASGTESGYSAALVVDGNTLTRWWRKGTSSQWLQVDLGSTKNIKKVTVRWHTYFAKSYQVQTSTDNRYWTTVASTTTGAGGVKEWLFNTRSARYVRINCQKTPLVNNVLSPNGFSIYELEVYAP